MQRSAAGHGVCVLGGTGLRTSLGVLAAVAGVVSSAGPPAAPIERAAAAEAYDVESIPMPRGFDYASTGYLDSHGCVLVTPSSPSGAGKPRTYTYLWRRRRLTPLAADADRQFLALGPPNSAHTIPGCVGPVSDEACLWCEGALHLLPAPRSWTNGWAAAVNERGDAAGRCLVERADGQWAERPYLWLRRGPTVPIRVELPTLGGEQGHAAGLNDRGDAVGWAETAAGVRHAVLWRGGKVIDLAPGESAQAVAINRQGEVAVTVFQEGNQYRLRARLWRAGVLHDLPWPGAEETNVTGLNDRGQAVGWARLSDHVERAVLWENERPIDVGALLKGAGAADLSPLAINNRGQILCLGTLQGQQSLLLLTPRAARPGRGRTLPSS